MVNDSIISWVILAIAIFYGVIKLIGAVAKTGTGENDCFKEVKQIERTWYSN